MHAIARWSCRSRCALCTLSDVQKHSERDTFSCAVLCCAVPYFAVHAEVAGAKDAAKGRLAEVVASKLSSTPGALELGALAAGFHLRVKALAASGKLHLASGYKLTPWRLMQAASAALAAAGGTHSPVVALAASLRLSYAGLVADEESRKLVVDTLQQALQAPELRKHAYTALTNADEGCAGMHTVAAGLAALEVAAASMCCAAVAFMAFSPSDRHQFVAQVGRPPCFAACILRGMHAAHPTQRGTS